MPPSTAPPAPVGADAQSEFFLAEGYLEVPAFLEPAEVGRIRAVYDKFLSGELDVTRHRYDLGAGNPVKQRDGVENITQIMWPSDIEPSLRDEPFRARALALARAVYREDTLEFDFDMLISKAPATNTPTPAHQDQAYWVELSDKRAVSMWISLDDATLDNGCMWYGPRTHLGPLRTHRRSGADANSALCCDATEDEMVPVPLAPGGAALHAGRTLHYSRGNTTPHSQRRALIMNFRPAAMIAAERAAGFDHGRGGHKIHAVRSSA